MRALTSTWRSWLVAALAAGLIWAVPASSPALGPSAAHGDFAHRVAIPGGRRLYLECRGAGRPTVVLEAGTGNLANIWSEPPAGRGPAVLPAVASFTRVCAYDRPGTFELPDVL